MSDLFFARIAFCLLALLPSGLAAQAPSEQDGRNEKRSIPKRIAAQWSTRVAAALQQAEKRNSDAGTASDGKQNTDLTDQEALNLLRGLSRSQSDKANPAQRPADPDSLLLDSPAD
ncbi:hypothetical protein OAM37_04685, partial [bacterium]|nr:hypothetical protein [bacterium]